jgi:hypothetical protein
MNIQEGTSGNLSQAKIDEALNAGKRSEPKQKMGVPWTREGMIKPIHPGVQAAQLENDRLSVVYERMDRFGETYTQAWGSAQRLRPDLFPE